MRQRINGFTIVELLVVIVVIGVLAAVTLVSYSGVSQRAIASSVQADLTSAANRLKVVQVDNGTYPTANVCPTPGATEICLKASPGTIFSYNSPSPYTTFTLTATNSGITYRITESTGPTISDYTALSNAGGGDWSKKSSLSFTNFQTNFQSRVDVSYRSSMKSDFSDLRFYDSTSKVELPYWVESYTSSASAVVWVKTGLYSTINMYYGNPSATSSSNGSNVFAFFDDFSGPLSTNWNTTSGGSGVWSVGSGLATLYAPRATNGNGNMETINSFTGQYRFRVRRKMNANAGLSYAYIGGATLSGGYQMNTNDCVDSEFITTGITGSRCGYNTVSPRTDDSVWHNIDISYGGTTTNLYIDDVLKTTKTATLDSSFKFGTGDSNASWKGADATVQYDYVYARLYTATDPTTTVGSEQSN